MLGNHQFVDSSRFRLFDRLCCPLMHVVHCCVRTLILPHVHFTAGSAQEMGELWKCLTCRVCVCVFKQSSKLKVCLSNKGSGMVSYSQPCGPKAVLHTHLMQLWREPFFSLSLYFFFLLWLCFLVSGCMKPECALHNNRMCIFRPLRF